MKYIQSFESLNEAKKSTIHRAAKKGSYPAVIVVVQDGKVIHQEPVSTPDIAPATFNVMQEKYPKALLHLEDNTGKRLFSESVVTEGEDTIGGLNKMANTDLERIADYADMIKDRMSQGQQLDAWMYSKISDSVKNLNSVHDTMDGNDGINEAKFFRLPKELNAMWELKNSVDYIVGKHKNGDDYKPEEMKTIEEFIKKIKQSAKAFKDAGEVKGTVYESVVNEAAKIETERYVRSHGKKPNGYGGWMFSYNRDGSDVNEESSFESFVNESHLWNPSMNKLVFGRGGNGTSQKYLEDSWKRRNFDIPASFFEEAHKEKNKSKQEELIKEIGLINDAHNTEKEALRTGEYFLEMWRKKNNLEYDKKTVFESLLGESTVNEAMDINDPVLMAIRARRTMLDKEKAAPKVKKISMGQYFKLMDKESDLMDQLKDASKEFEQLDSDMNQEAGQKGDSWSDADANRYGGDLEKLQTKIEKLALQKKNVQDQLLNYRMS